MKSKEQKRIEAEVRSEEYDALTTQQKIARATERPGRSVKEQSRLWKLLGGKSELV